MVYPGRLDFFFEFGLLPREKSRKVLKKQTPVISSGSNVEHHPVLFEGSTS